MVGCSKHSHSRSQHHFALCVSASLLSCCTLSTNSVRGLKYLLVALRCLRYNSDDSSTDQIVSRYLIRGAYTTLDDWIEGRKYVTGQ